MNNSWGSKGEMSACRWDWGDFEQKWRMLGMAFLEILFGLYYTIYRKANGLNKYGWHREVAAKMQCLFCLSLRRCLLAWK